MKRHSTFLWCLTTLCLIAAFSLQFGCKHKPKTEPTMGTQSTTDKNQTSTEKKSDLTEKEFHDRYVAEKERVLQDINFDYDRWNLEMKARANLSGIGDWLMKNPKVKLLVEGHCDERGSTEYNLALGQKRANAAKEYLVDFGISAARLSTISYGKERPLNPGHDESAYSKNRRDHFLVLEE